MLLKIFNKIGRLFLTIIILVYIVFEELVWERFSQPIIRFINRLKILQKLGEYLQTVNSKVILFIFVMLFALVETQGLYAASLFVQGKVLHGVLVYAGKVPVSAFTFWLFREVKPKLMTFIWFDRAYTYVMMLIAKITDSQTYLTVKSKAVLIKRYIKDYLSSHEGSFKKKVQTLYKKLRKRVNQDL